MSDIVYDWFVRTPFAVEATLITEENIDAIAEMVGEVRTKRTDDKEERFIALDRRVVPNVGRAYIGWYLTRLGDNLRCYSPKIFKEQFIEMPADQPVAFTFIYGGEEEPKVLLNSEYPQGSPLVTDAPTIGSPIIS